MISANSDRKPGDDGAAQRQKLEDSERKATDKQPQNYKDESTDDKVVEISPPGSGKRPIEGLDPD